MEKIENVNPIDLRIGDIVRGVLGEVAGKPISKGGRVHVRMNDGGHIYTVRMFTDAKLTVHREG
jgi:hypothetical protein